MIIRLGITQMIGWGTTYYLPAILRHRFEQDLGLSETLIFGAATIMLVVSAFTSIPMGKFIDRNGARLVMVCGSGLFIFALLILSITQGIVGYIACWTVMGLGMTACLSNAAFAAISQVAGDKARRSIGMILLMGGLASSVFWPLTFWLDAHMGWRNVCLLYALLNALICLPMHYFGLPRDMKGRIAANKENPDLLGSLPQEARRKAAVLMVLASASFGFVSWGLDLHMITVLAEFGLGLAAAVGVAAMKGPAAITARAIDIFSAGRVTPLASALVAGLLILLGLMIAVLIHNASYAPVLFMVVFSFGTGLMTIARATLPLTLLGAVGYATTMGRFALPTQLVYASAPLVFGLLIEANGVRHTLALAIVIAALGFISLFVLARLAKASSAHAPERHEPGQPQNP